MSKEKIRPREELASICSALKRGGYTLVSTNGVFDILHLGHVQILEMAKALGNFLLVGVNSDSSTRQLNKGKGRPLMDENSRAMIIAALEMVDYVTIFPESTPIELLEIVKPTIHVKGGDYKLGDGSPEDEEKKDLPERVVVEKYGGRVEIIPFQTNISTSEIISRAYAVHLHNLIQQLGDETPLKFLSQEPTEIRRFHIPMPNRRDLEMEQIEIPLSSKDIPHNLHLGPRCLDVLRPNTDKIKPVFQRRDFDSGVATGPEIPIDPKSEAVFFIGTLGEDICEELQREIKNLFALHKSKGMSFSNAAAIILKEFTETRIPLGSEGELFQIIELWTEANPTGIDNVIKFKAMKIE